MTPELHHFTLGYKLKGNDRACRFHTYALDNEQAIQDLFNFVPDVLSGSVLFKLKAPAGARRSSHD
jgi:hypothetical protein